LLTPPSLDQLLCMAISVGISYISHFRASARSVSGLESSSRTMRAILVAKHKIQRSRTARESIGYFRCTVCGLEIVAGVPRKKLFRWKEIPPAATPDSILESIPCDRSFDPGGPDWISEQE